MEYIHAWNCDEYKLWFNFSVENELILVMANGGGTGQWFNDRRFSFNGPQRLRDNVTQILNDLNNQARN